MQQVHEQPSKAYAWVTLALFVSLAIIVGIALFAQPTHMQVVQTGSPLPVEQVIPPITQPVP